MREWRPHIGRVMISPKLAHYEILSREYSHSKEEKQLAFAILSISKRKKVLRAIKRLVRTKFEQFYKGH